MLRLVRRAAATTAVIALAVGVGWPQASRAVSAGDLAITPPVSELSILAGQTVTDRITVQNASGEALTVTSSVGDLVVADDELAFGVGGGDPGSAAGWVTLEPASVDMPAGSTTTITATIRVPIGVAVGGHYAAVRVQGSVPGRAAVAAVHAMLIEVPGEGLLRSIAVRPVALPKVALNGSVVVRVNVVNRGNTHARIEGVLIVRDRLRRRVVAMLSVPPFYVLPGRTGGENVVWEDPPVLAVPRVTARLVLVGDTPFSAPAVTGAGLVVHWLLAAGAAAALLVLGAVPFAVRRLRRERRAPAQAEIVHARSAWERPGDAGEALARRRARTAARMLREGAGGAGAALEVALGLLRTVRGSPAVVAEVESAYAETLSGGADQSAGALALGLHEVSSPRAAEALLRGYAVAEEILARRLRRALAECDPADLRAHHELLGSLPPQRRQELAAR